MTYNNGAPTTYDEWFDQGHEVIPCKDKRPVIKEWSERKFQREVWKHKYHTGYQLGLKLGGKTDIDIDNPIIKKFINLYLKSCGAIYGRKSNPSSHYLFLEELKSFKYNMPNELEHYCKGFPHGNTLLEIRSSNSHQSIVPGSIVMDEDVEWSKYASINSYDGNLISDISKVVLSTALSILYAPKGHRDAYCTAIAGVLSNHADWDEDEINNFIYNLAIRSDDHEPNKRMAKGTHAKNNKTRMFGMPKLAEILNCSTKTIAEIFSWVGVKDSGSLFTEIKVYETEPKYWQLKYRDNWLTIMDSSHLLSYTKIAVYIVENCYEIPPVVSPKDWRVIIGDLLKNVVKVEAPQEASYYGHVGLVFLNFLDRWKAQDKIHLGTNATWLNPEDNHYYFRLDCITEELQRKRISYELRKLTHYLREEHGAEPTKITLNKKEIRCWKVHKDELNKVNKQTLGRAEIVSKKMDAEYEKSKNAF